MPTIDAGGLLGALGVQVFTNINGHALDEPPPVARTIRTSIDFFGPEHVLFATDWPFGPPTEEASIGPTLGALGELGLSPHDLALVLGDNARSLLGLAVTQ